MLDTYVNHGDKMNEIINTLRLGRVIEAIKMHRTLYGTGLKESKDAVEAIKAALRLGAPWPAAPLSVPQFMVFSRHNESDYDYARYTADDRADANSFAARVCNSREDVLVVQVVAKSVTEKSMKAV